MWHLRVKTYSDASYLFSRGSRPPTSRDLRPDNDDDDDDDDDDIIHNAHNDAITLIKKVRS